MPRQGENYFVYADPQKCLGCKSCEIACGLAHAGVDLFTAVLEGYRVQPRNVVVQAGSIRTPMQCRQCEEAPCVLVCPSGALSHENGLVWLRRSACFGCKSCMMVCPFGAITVRPEGKDTGGPVSRKAKALKCDLCFERTGKVSEENCACVQACPTKAIRLVDGKRLRRERIAARAGELAQAHVSAKKEINQGGV